METGVASALLEIAVLSGEGLLIWLKGWVDTGLAGWLKGVDELDVMGLKGTEGSDVPDELEPKDVKEGLIGTVVLAAEDDEDNPLLISEGLFRTLSEFTMDGVFTLLVWVGEIDT